MELSRSSDISNRRFKDSTLKKPQKINSKNLNSAFNAVSDKFSASSEISKESSDLSPNSEISKESSDLSTISEISCPGTENSTPGLPPALAASSEVLFKTIGSLDEDFVEKILEAARTHLSKSPYADIRYKRLLDAIIKVIANEIRAMHTEQNWFAKFLPRKGCISFFLFLLMVFLLAVRFFALSSHNLFSGPPPT